MIISAVFVKLKKRSAILGMLLLLFFIPFNIQAQSDPAFTQFVFNPYIANPAYTGVRDAITLAFSDRHQWLGLDTRISTQTFNVQTPINYTTPSYGQYQAGRTSGANMAFGLVNDQIGAFKTVSGSVDYSYLFSINETIRMSLGMRLGFQQLSMNLAGLSWIDPGDPLLAESRLTQSNASVGVGVYLFEHNRWYLGLSAPTMYHTKPLNKTMQTELDVHDYTYVYMSGGLVWSMNRDIRLRPSVLLRLASGTSFAAEVATHIILKDKLWLGTSFRYGDAMIFSMAYDVLPGVKVSYSYDYGINSLNQFHYGTHEITLMWDLYPRSFVKRYHCYL